MKKIRAVVVAGVCLLSVLSVVAQQREETEGKPLIGMAAYEEVLASGNYMVGPQDEFLIYVPGMDEPVIHEVLAEGSLFIPMVGMVKIGGLRLSEAHDKMEEEFRKNVKLGRIDVELSKPRVFPVPVLGLVQIPGTRQGSAVQRVSQMIVGALDQAGSTRNIRVFNTRTLLPAEAARVESSIRRGDWTILRNLPSKRVDLVLYATTADAKYNPFVEDGDIVVIPPQLGKIGALEAVNRSRIFEFVEGDRISVLLMLAQGPAPNHDPENAVLQRYDEDNTTMYEVKVDLAAVLRGDDAADLPLKPGDQLILRANPEFHERSTIDIAGEVNIPGIHVVEKTGTSLKAMIERAGGFTGYQTLQEARIIRAILINEKREIGDPEFERILTIPPGDRTEEDNQYFKMRVREKPGHLVVDFEALYNDGDESQNVRLLPGDFVHIPRRQHTVMVSGRAASPGAVIYNPDHGVYDYIEQAGGFGWRATKEVRVIKASTGEIQRAEDVARIDPGDRIWIKEKPVRNYWVVFAQSMAVIGQVTTVVLLYVTLTK